MRSIVAGLASAPQREEDSTRRELRERQRYVMLRLWIVCLLTATSLWGADSGKLAREAAKAARRGDYVTAFRLYSQAALQAPYSTYAEQSQAMLASAAINEQIRMQVAPSEGGETAQLEARSEAAVTGSVTVADVREAKQPLPPLRLDASDARIDLDERAVAKTLWTGILQRFGLEAVFDEGVRDGQPVELELTGADYRTAIRALELVTNTIALPVGEKLLLVVENSQNAQTQYEPTAAVAIPLPQALQNEEATEIANALRQALEIRTVMVDTNRRILLLRDRYAKVLTAQALAQEMMEFPQDVVLEVELREVNRRSLSRFGIGWPTRFAMTVFTTWLNNQIEPVTGFTNYATFGGGASLVGIGITSLEAIAFMSRNESDTLYRAEMRGSSGKESDLNIGQQYPILQSTFFTGPVEEQESATFYPQVTLQQLGLSIKATPTVWNDTVTLDLQAEVVLLTGESSNGIPVLANRVTSTRVQVKQGQTIAVAGLLNRTEAKNITGLAGLNSIPGIGALFRQTTTEREEIEMVILLTPRVLHSRADRGSSPTWFTGTSTRFVAPL